MPLKNIHPKLQKLWIQYQKEGEEEEEEGGGGRGGVEELS